MTQVFLLNTNNALVAFPDPGNWNPVNKIECVGAGAPGGGPQTAPELELDADAPPRPEQFATGGGSGGGGGGYAYGDNVAVTFPLQYIVFNGGTLSGSNWFVAFSTTNPQGTDGAVRVQNGYGSSGGTNKFPAGANGGGGGLYNTNNNWMGAGGGGAGGPSGNGSAGVAANAAGSAGGAANAGSVPGGAAGQIGNSGTQFDATHGCGSGAGGSKTSAVGPRGGFYGGGGGGGIWTSSYFTGGQGGEGLIILTYVPFVAPAGGAMAMIMV